jgi:hypothetical protein
MVFLYDLISFLMSLVSEGLAYLQRVGPGYIPRSTNLYFLGAFSVASVLASPDTEIDTDTNKVTETYTNVDSDANMDTYTDTDTDRTLTWVTQTHA